MLETIREYALERLEQSGEAGAVRQRHLELLSQPRGGGPGLTDRALRRGTLRACSARPGAMLRAALDWALAAEPRTRVCRLVVALEHFWVSYGPRRGGRAHSRVSSTVCRRPSCAPPGCARWAAPRIKSNELRASPSAATRKAAEHLPRARRRVGDRAPAHAAGAQRTRAWRPRHRRDARRSSVSKWPGGMAP